MALQVVDENMIKEILDALDELVRRLGPEKGLHAWERALETGYYRDRSVKVWLTPSGLRYKFLR